jgi:hypothetical protein
VLLFVVGIVDKANYRADQQRTLFPLLGVGREGAQVKEDPHASKQTPVAGPGELDALEGDHPMPDLRGCSVAIRSRLLPQGTPGAGRIGHVRGEGGSEGHLRQLRIPGALGRQTVGIRGLWAEGREL